MRFSSATLVAGFLATANAFLLLPNIEEIKEDFKDARFKGAPKHFKDLMHSLLEEKTTVIDLECPGCPFASTRLEDQSIEGTVWQQDTPNAIHLEFDTHDNGLNLNGRSLLPLERLVASPPPLMAHQLKADSAEKSVDIQLSFVVEVLPSIPSPHKDEISLIPVEVTILKMNEIPVKVDTIALKLIKTPQDSYAIVQTEQIPFETTPGAETCKGARPWALCRVRAIIADKVRKVVEASKEKVNKVHGWVKDKTSGCGNHRNSSGRPHPHGRHPRPPHWIQRHGHHNHRFSQLSHTIHQTLRFFVVPALLGIIGGLAASAIGMLVGQAIVFLWFRTYRNGQRGSLRICEQDVTTFEEQDGLLKSAETVSQHEDTRACEKTLLRDIEAEVAGQENEKQ